MISFTLFLGIFPVAFERVVGLVFVVWFILLDWAHNVTCYHEAC